MRFAAILARAVLAAMSLACSERSPPPAAPSAAATDPSAAVRPLILGTTSEPATLDPAFATLSGHQEVITLLFRGLTRFDAKGQVAPELAAALPILESRDGSTRVRWTLRSGLRWSDGAALTAEDLVFGHRIEADPMLEAISHHVAKKVLRIEALDAATARVAWALPYADYLAPRVHAILPRHAYPEPDPPRPFQGLGRTPVSSGPYRLVSWQAGERLVLEANPFWSPAPAIPRIIVRFFPSADAFGAELRTGRLDALGEASGLSLDQAEALVRPLAKTHVVQFSPSGLWLHLVCRLDDPVVGQLAFRRAVDAALDKEALAKLVYGGRAAAAQGLFPPYHPGHLRKPASIEARREAGAALRAVAQTSDGTRLTLQFASGSEAAARAATAIRAQLEQFGLTLTLRAVPFGILAQQLKEHEQPPLTLYAFRIRPDWDGRSNLHSTGRQNFGGLKDRELDRLLDAAERELDRQAWRTRVRAIGRRFQELLPSIPLLFRESVSLRPRTLSGWQPTGTTTPVTATAEDWRWVDEPADRVVP